MAHQPLLQDMAQLAAPLEAYLANSDADTYQPLLDALTAMAQKLARDHDYRQAMSNDPGKPLILIFNASRTLWNTYQTHRQQAPQQTPEQKQADLDSHRPRHSYDVCYRDVQLLVLALRCCRNSMAHCSQAQSEFAAALEETFLDIFVGVTAFTALTDPDVIPLARTCAQVLCNLIAANPTTQEKVWNTIVLAPQAARRLVHRFLTSPDTATQSAAQIVLINLLKTSDTAVCRARCKALSTDTAGLQLVETLLSLADSIILQTSMHPDDDDAEFAKGDGGATTSTDEAEHRQLEESLRLINELITLLFANGMASELLRGLAPLETIGSSHTDRPIVNAAQLSLLKLLDSWLHFGVSSAVDISFAPGVSALGGLEGLMDLFLYLSRFVREAMRKGLENREDQDKRVVGVHQVLLLVLQCLLSLGLMADGWSEDVHDAPTPVDLSLKATARRYLAALREREGMVHELVALLHQTALFAPPVSPFKLPPQSASQNGMNGAASATQSLPEGHVLSSTGSANLSQTSDDEEKRFGFDHLKRDLVRVLGTLVYAPTTAGEVQPNPPIAQETARQVRRVQDEVREAGGLFDVMNMTVLDERNPYMREHAIFTLRYLLAGNLESQDLVRRLQPVDANGQGGLQMPFS